MNLNLVMAVSGSLLLICVYANRISIRYGIPSLLFFLGLGMLAGSDGLGIQFNNAHLANYAGTFALAFILFSGGLDTKWTEVKPTLKRGSLLSTLGVFLTALFLFICTRYILRLSYEVSLLLSVIVSSTDAPAVFSILRSQKQELKSGIKPLLEFESGSNDPMAVLLSLGALNSLSDPDFSTLSLIEDFLWQMSLGLAAGYVFGQVSCYVLRRWNLVYPGLYPVFGISVVLLTYSLTQLLDGNGFLAVYIAGIIMGNTVFLYRRHFINFQDSLAWIMQIGMFLLLGLLVNPHELPAVFPISLLCAIFLIFVARPLAVFACLYKSTYTTADKIFISWAGFKGAVPIILATYPLMYNYPDSSYLFNIIFFLVILSVLVQGKSLPYLAKKLKLY